MNESNDYLDKPYHQAYFKTSHNSFNRSVREQLNNGVRGLEYDVHDNNIKEVGDFEVPISFTSEIEATLKVKIESEE